VPSNHLIWFSRVININFKSKSCKHVTSFAEIKCGICSKSFLCTKCHAKNSPDGHAFKFESLKCLKCESVSEVFTSKCSYKYCDLVFADYCCTSCYLLDSRMKFTHCTACNICRPNIVYDKLVQYDHCKTCNTCYTEKHICMESNTSCAICLTEFSESRLLSVAYGVCGHKFHYTCYKKHLQNSDKCPICRTNIIKC